MGYRTHLIGVYLLLELAGDHPDLPCAELDLLGTVMERGTQVAVVQSCRPRDIPRLALTQVAMEFLGSCPAEKAAFRRMLADLAITSPRPFAARVKKVHGSTIDTSQAELERIIGSRVSGEVDLRNPGEEFRAVISGSKCYFGRVLWRNDPKRFASRRPGDRPFFHPGVMMPRMVRALINISCIREREWLLDPFCGTGGMIVEAGLLGICAVGSDTDPEMVRGSRMNAGDQVFLGADCRSLPFQDESFDAVVTDLPYGQSVSIRAQSIDALYPDALEEIARVVKPGRRAILVTHRDIRSIASHYMEIEGCHSQRVHRSLTRHIMVLRKK